MNQLSAYLCGRLQPGQDRRWVLTHVDITEDPPWSRNMHTQEIYVQLSAPVVGSDWESAMRQLEPLRMYFRARLGLPLTRDTFRPPDAL